MHNIAAASKGQARRKKNKSDYFNEHNPPQKYKPSVYKFDMISDESRSAYKKTEPEPQKHYI